RRSRCRKADDVLGTDVGGKNRGAYNHPAQPTAGQEIVRRGSAIFHRRPPDDNHQNAEICRDDPPVDCGHNWRTLPRIADQQSAATFRYGYSVDFLLQIDITNWRWPIADR